MTVIAVSGITNPSHALPAPVGPAGAAGKTVVLPSATQGVPPRAITVPQDRSTLTSQGVTVVMNPTMQDTSSYLGQLNAAGIPCTINVAGLLVLTRATSMPTVSDPNLLKVLGLT